MSALAVFLFFGSIFPQKITAKVSVTYDVSRAGNDTQKKSKEISELSTNNRKSAEIKPTKSQRQVQNNTKKDNQKSKQQQLQDQQNSLKAKRQLVQQQRDQNIKNGKQQQLQQLREQNIKNGKLQQAQQLREEKKQRARKLEIQQQRLRQNKKLNQGNHK